MKKSRKKRERLLGKSLNQDDYRLQSIKRTEKYSNIEIDIKKRKSSVTRIPAKMIDELDSRLCNLTQKLNTLASKFSKDLKNANGHFRNRQLEAQGELMGSCIRATKIKTVRTKVAERTETRYLQK